MNYRKGDVVSVQGTVKHNFDPDETDADKRVFIDIIGTHETIWIKPEHLKLIQHAFEIGDRIAFGTTADDGAGEGHLGTILAIADDHAWVDLGGGSYCTRTLTSINRVASEA